VLGISAALALGACAAPDFDSMKRFDLSSFRPSSVAALRETVTRPVTAGDLVDGEGRCASAATANPDAPGDPAQASIPAIPAGIAVEMTECEVVRRAGQPERVEIGTNERNERAVTLTYVRGARPGIYRFTSGRLTAMERVAEPPAPARPARPARQQKRT
jgi:hypothetical protein